VNLPAAGQGQNPALLEKVGIDQRLDEQLPLDLTFRDENGGDVQLSRFFGEKPILLSFAYYTCPMLCPMELEGITKVLKVLPFQLGQEFEAINISIHPGETPEDAAKMKEDLVKRLRQPAAEEGWHFLTGDEPSIKQAADAAGFHYAYDAELEQYVHAAGIMVLTPEGKFSRYFYGIEYAERDLRLGLIEAAAEKIGSPVDQVLLYCYHYDPVTGKYGLVIMNIMRIFAAATVLALVTFMIIQFRKDKYRRKGVTAQESA
jgi:protein SCO1/2